MRRRTHQRAAIRSAIGEADRPLSPYEILSSAQEQAPGLGIATVYRNIRALVEEGWLRAVDLPGAPSRYGVAGKGHHHHVHCRSCDRVFEVDDCPGRVADLAPAASGPRPTTSSSAASARVAPPKRAASRLEEFGFLELAGGPGRDWHGTVLTPDPAAWAPYFEPCPGSGSERPFLCVRDRGFLYPPLTGA